MKANILLLGASLGMAGLVNGYAQVYSSNMIGYIPSTIPHGWSIIANPVNQAGGDTIANVFPNPPENLNVYTFSHATASYQMSVYDAEFKEWSYPNLPIQPGTGVFVWNGGTNFPWLFLGDVPMGTRGVYIGHGYNLVACPWPMSGRLQTDLGYRPSIGAGKSDSVYKYVNASGSYELYIWDGEFQEWWWVEPTIQVGEGFWLIRGGEGILWPGGIPDPFEVGQ